MLRVDRLSKSFATPDGMTQAVKGIGFEVAEGEFYTLVGPSGCGKTTTLRCIAGLERPSGGAITIADVTVDEPDAGVHVPSHLRDIGMVFQSYAIWPHLNVFENVAYPLRVTKPAPVKSEIEQRVMDSLQLVGMGDLARRSATKLSGGQQQRVALARALVRKPKLLLLDEPLSNLDAKLREQMRVELEEMVARVGLTTIYVTHDQAEALSMSDRVAVMSEGLIAQEGSPRDVYARPATQFVASFLGVANVLTGIVGGPDTVVLDDGAGRLSVPLSNGFETGARIRVVVRPEDIEIRADGADGADNCIAGRLERVVFEGAQSECFIRAKDYRIRVRVHQATDAREGDDIWLRILPDRCVVFHQDGN